MSTDSPSMASTQPTLPVHGQFSGLWVALVTPFKPNGDIDHAALHRLVSRLAAEGVRGLVACGSTGEAAALDAAEQRAVLDTVLDAAQHAGGLPVIAGAGGLHLGDVRAWLRTLSGLSLAGVLLPAPHYIRPSQAGAIDWFTALADASPAPLVLYDIPYRTGTTLTRDTLLTLAAHPNIAAIKDCGGDTGKTLALIADGRLQVLAGEDLNLFATVAQGGAGAIAATAHLHTRRLVDIVDLLQRGDLVAAQALWLPLLPYLEAAFTEPNPAPLKALLAHRGEMGETLRSPMHPVSAALRDRLIAIHQTLGESAVTR